MAFLTRNHLGWTTIQINRTDRVHPSQPPTPAYAAQHVILSFDEIDDLLDS